MFGRQSNTGYPMFIGLYGGGTETAPGLYNTGSWIDASNRYFSLPLQAQTKVGGVFQNEGAILVVPRGVSNLSNGGSLLLHSEPESYVHLEALIADLLQKKPQPVFDNAQKNSQQSNNAAPYLIDPDRVFLTGYSAGGNSVFQLSQRTSDRFAAGNPNASRTGSTYTTRSWPWTKPSRRNTCAGRRTTGSTSRRGEPTSSSCYGRIWSISITRSMCTSAGTGRTRLFR